MTIQLTSDPIVVIHYDERGEVNYLYPKGVRVIVIDDRAPTDRVYEMNGPSSYQEIFDLIGQDKILDKDYNERNI